MSSQPQLKATPRIVWRVWQNKYVLDRLPLWKLCFYWGVYMPIAWLTYFVVKIPILNRIDSDGKVCWEEDQGTFSSREKAREVMDGRRNWFAKSAEEDVVIAEATCQAGEHLCPGSPAARLYARPTRMTGVSIPHHTLRVLERALGEGERI